ncbi:hypothetical protein [Curtobacterium flaccumfaciens]|uniref:MmyB family transcriptional regulator n=1 Tax=Curtobacterium flaccumfaciens TaxID=2035 RepID=UPI003EB6A4EC
MNRNGAGNDAPDGVSELVGAIRCLPAVVTDRHLTVVASNSLARALSGAFRPTVNIARYAFLNPVVDDASPEWWEASGQIVAMLRDSLDQHEEDAGFRKLVGELSSQSIAFARAWADVDHRPARSAAVRFVQPFVGPITMVFQELMIPDDFALRMLLWRPVDHPAEHDAFARLAAFAAEQD